MNETRISVFLAISIVHLNKKKKKLIILVFAAKITIFFYQPEHTMQCLKKEEEGKRLYQHLYDYQVVDELPLNEWFHTCYANVLPDNSLER